MLKIFTTLTIQLIFLSTILAQGSIDDIIDPMPIRLKGKVVNVEDGSVIPYAHLVNMRTHGGTTTDGEGNFTMDMLNVDSLAFTAMGFVKMYVHVPPDHNENNTFIVNAKPIRFAIKEVEVQGNKKKIDMGLPSGKAVDIDPELRGDAFNSKPPIIAALFTPLSFMQYHFSKDEKEKRDVRKAIISEAQWQILSQTYNKETVMRLTGLKEDEADDFMIYFNSKNLLSYNSSEYDVRSAILQQYRLYKQEKLETE